MQLQSMDYLCCPACNGNFELSIKEKLEAEVIQGVLECCECKKRFEITDGLPNLIFPERLELSDMREQINYDKHPRLYDLRMRLLGLKFGIWEGAFLQTRSRQRLVSKLELRKNDSVLETGTGTGIALSSIAKQIGPEGQLHGSDISAGMLMVARKKMKAKRIRAELLQANASYLPYRTSVFNAVMHIGGWNTFADKKRAMEEMHRVAKSGAKILICDEGLAPGKEKTWRGRRVLKHDTRGIYSMKPPSDFVPDNIEGLKIYWVWKDLYWVVEFAKK